MVEQNFHTTIVYTLRVVYYHCHQNYYEYYIGRGLLQDFRSSSSESDECEMREAENPLAWAPWGGGSSLITPHQFFMSYCGFYVFTFIFSPELKAIKSTLLVTASGYDDKKHTYVCIVYIAYFLAPMAAASAAARASARTAFLVATEWPPLEGPSRV